MTVNPALMELAGRRDLGVLATIKRDGRPQLSHVNFALDASR
ncbi:MAG: pyridoxamine 5'-phosphate oxidase family protein, partial [Propionibacteriales bacterium]|nr:pyridoxamine 5'-phosphate oxidase family protein [Propionibacteriales bacterium]